MTALVWGVRASLLAYLADIGDGTTTCEGGAEPVGDDRFRWPARETADGFSGTGTVRFEAHGGLLDVRLVAPALVLEPDGAATLSVARGDGVLEVATGRWTEPGDAVVRVELRLTSGGARLLGDVYPVGSALDDLVVER